MISPELFYQALKSRGICFFAGVPDSLLKNFCAYLDDHSKSDEHVIAANEGNAVATAAGYHLSTGKLTAVYLQNSGIGNTINPLTSLVDPEVYRIPILMIIGWRGEPGIKDEPQHIKQGRITTEQLSLLEIPYWIMDADTDVKTLLNDAFDTLHSSGATVALLVRKGSFSNYKSSRLNQNDHKLQREEALRLLLNLIGPEDLVIATTGKTSRELFELRLERGEPMKDFLTVGSMGHTASIAFGAALGHPRRKVVCLDGDGSVLMHFGALPVIGKVKAQNLIHVVLNNGAHESVGGQPTAADRIDFNAIARASGYANYHQAIDQKTLVDCWKSIQCQNGPILFEIKIRLGSRNNLGRPAFTPEQNKFSFMEHACDRIQPDTHMGTL